jgi:hypothetical protein
MSSPPGAFERTSRPWTRSHGHVRVAPDAHLHAASGSLAQGLDDRAIGQRVGRYIDLPLGLAEQANVDPFQILARRVVDLRRAADRTRLLGGAGVALERRSEQEGGQHEKPPGREWESAKSKGPPFRS